MCGLHGKCRSVGYGLSVHGPFALSLLPSPIFPRSRPTLAGGPQPAGGPGRAGRDPILVTARHTPALSVIIACRNGAATLGETLEGLVAQRWDRPWEIVLADNGSTDGSAALFRAVAAAHPECRMRVVDASGRPGKPFALNTGIAAARAPALAFCDADDVPGEGWLAAMGKALPTTPSSPAASTSTG